MDILIGHPDEAIRFINCNPYEKNGGRGGIRFVFSKLDDPPSVLEKFWMFANRMAKRWASGWFANF